MRGLILINAYFKGEEYLYQPERLREEFAKLGVAVDVLRNDFFPCYVEENVLKSKLGEYDFCLFYDKDKYVLKGLSMLGIPLFNSYESILTCDDKMLTYLALTGEDIPMPKTLPGLLCYSPIEPIAKETYIALERELGYPIVVKESYGSQGKGVYLARNREELAFVLEQVKCKPHLCQKFIDTSYGKDVRVMVIGGKVIGGMLRASKGDFRSNLGAGGKGIPFPPTEVMVKTAERIAKVLDLEYCGIDFLFGEEGFVVCEVNSNAFFYGFERCAKINVAKLYAEHIVNKIKRK